MTLSIQKSESVINLGHQLRPFRMLHAVGWQQLITTQGKKGWLAVARQVYYTMKATAPLLQFAATTAARRSEERQENFGDFISWAERHAEEEKEHYCWYIDDLQAMDIDTEAVEQSVPESAILGLLGAQFGLIATTHPVALLGYFFATECHPPDPDQVHALARRFSIPDAGLRTILFHADKDVTHRSEIIALLDQYGRLPAFREAILASAIEEITGWTTLFQQLSEATRRTPATPRQSR